MTKCFVETENHNSRTYFGCYLHNTLFFIKRAFNRSINFTRIELKHDLVSINSPCMKYTNYSIIS